MASDSTEELTTFEIVIDDETGEVTTVYDDAVVALLQDIFETTSTRRATHIEPTASGWWQVDAAPILNLSEPKIIGTFRYLQDAKDFEVAWLKDRLGEPT